MSDAARGAAVSVTFAPRSESRERVRECHDLQAATVGLCGQVELVRGSAAIVPATIGRTDQTMKLMAFLERFGWDTAAHVTHIEWTRDTHLIVNVDAYPFWLAEPQRDERKRLTIRLNHVVESCIDLDWEEVALKELRVSTVDPLLWHYRQFATVYGSSPIPDPGAFLAAFLDKCSELGVVRDCLQYLNAETGLERWGEIVQGSSYAILSAPIKICDAAQELLHRQNVRFTTLPGLPRDHAWAREAVWVDTSWIICMNVDIDAEGA